MKEFVLKPVIHRCKTAAEFAGEFDIGKGDLVLTNEYIYNPYFGSMNLKCDVIFQEKYGAGEPTDEMVESIYRDIPQGIKRIIAIGGGTIIDIAKIYALKNVSPVLDLYDGKLPIERDKKLVLVPTTCGTGSEVTNIAILALLSRGTKKGLAVDEMYADDAVLVPEFLKGLPFGVFATSSIDALVHAVESSLSPKANTITKMFGYKAIEMILSGYKAIAKDGQDARFEYLEDFLAASHYAGIAFGNAGCAAVHAMAYPLGATYHVAHGESNYAMFTGVMKTYMGINPHGEIVELNEFMAKILGCKESFVYEELEKLLNTLIRKKPLREYGMKEDEIEAFADSVMENQQRLLANNFVPLTRNQIRDIYAILY